jgi:hypothetical protein
MKKSENVLELENIFKRFSPKEMCHLAKLISILQNRYKVGCAGNCRTLTDHTGEVFCIETHAWYRIDNAMQGRTIVDVKDLKIGMDFYWVIPGVLNTITRITDKRITYSHNQIHYLWPGKDKGGRKAGHHSVGRERFQERLDSGDYIVIDKLD